MTNDKTVTMSRELAERIFSYTWFPSGAGLEADQRLNDREKLRALLAAPVVERQPVAWRHTMHYEHGHRFELTDSPENPFGKPDIYYDKSFRVTCEPLYTSPPAPVAVTHPFADKVIRKLQRFHECMDDGQGADIGRHWFDLLTQLGLLNRVRRSPALWEISQQGEDCLDKVKELNQ